MVKIEFNSLTRQGDAPENDDSLAIIRSPTNEVLIALADGLGGHKGGAEASAAVTSAIKLLWADNPTLFHQPAENWNDSFKDLFQQVNQSLLQKKRLLKLHEMRTTLVLFYISHEKSLAMWGHCGDSRLYHIRESGIVGSTKDHSVAQMLVAQNELTRDRLNAHPERHRLTRSLGSDGPESRPRVIPEPVLLEAGDRFLICSDGWWEYLSDSEIVELSGLCEQASPSANGTNRLEFWMTEMDALIKERIVEKTDVVHKDDRTAAVMQIS